MLPGVLSARECQALAALYSKDSVFRSRVVIGQHGFGRGEYKYFSYPLPRPDSRSRYSALPSARASRESLEHGHGDRRPLPGNSPGFSPGNATMRGSSGQRLCSSTTARVISTACIRIFMGSTSSRYRWQYCFQNRRKISPAANSCSPSNGLECNSTSRGCSASPRRRGVVRGAPSPGSRNAGNVSRQSSPWRKPPSVRTTVHGWHHLS